MDIDVGSEVNRKVVRTSIGVVEIVALNSEGKLVLPKEWYDPEDDVYDDLYDKYVELMDISRKDS